MDSMEDNFPIVHIPLEELNLRWNADRFDKLKVKHIIEMYDNAFQAVRNNNMSVQRARQLYDIINSILEIGLVNPLIVKKIDNNKYCVVVGNQRLYALRYLKLYYIDKYNKLFPSNMIPCRIAAEEHSWNDNCQLLRYYPITPVEGIDKTKR